MKRTRSTKTQFNNLYSVKDALIDLCKDVFFVVEGNEKDRDALTVYTRWSTCWKGEVIQQNTDGLMQGIKGFEELSALFAVMPTNEEFDKWALAIADKLADFLMGVVKLISNMEALDNVDAVVVQVKSAPLHRRALRSVKSTDEILVSQHWAYFRDGDYEWFIKHPKTEEWVKVFDIMPVGLKDDNQFAIHCRHASGAIEWFEPVDGKEKLSRSMPLKSVRFSKFRSFRYRTGQRVYVKPERRYGTITGMYRTAAHPVYKVQLSGKANKERHCRVHEISVSKPSR